MTVAETLRPAFPVGSLVKARGREWVVLPESDNTVLVVRPLGGADDDVAGILRGIEPIESATFPPPAPDDLGDDRSARLLRDALRIGFRSSGGPFRSLAALAVEPRPYQLVPLLLALRQDTVRLLIADDVGIGKTVEAGLVAAELLAQGSARGLTVLCPPSLAEQWRVELNEKFGMDAELVLPGTVRQLERGLSQDESVFERYPVTIVSTDFIKAERRKYDFLRTAPDLVIVDEAHSSVSDDMSRTGGRTQRFELLSRLADDADRHLVLVTATPHSGKEGAFRNLIGLLDPALKTADLSTDKARALLADHMVQRRRADIRDYLNADTTFPSDRQTTEQPYKLTPAHRDLFDDVLAYVRGQVQDTSGTTLEQRVRWWSALSLLRTMASSPAAAATTLKNRSSASEADTVPAANGLGAADVLDSIDDEALDGADATPGAIPSKEDQDAREKRILSDFRRRAEELENRPQDDAKLATLTKTVKKLLADNFHPVVFCRFIQTADYVAKHLRSSLRNTDVGVVTGILHPDDRAGRVRQLSEDAQGKAKVLVATDCLSEGVNLQQDFQAVVHYDLAWNPTRHEQREGRVDRFGQPADIVRAVMIYGEDTGIDGIVLDVLLRKHEAIRRDLGISVPVPSQSDQVLSALIEGVLMRGREDEQLALDIGGRNEAEQLETEWRSTAEAEKQSRTRFAQRSIDEVDVAREVEAARSALGRPSDVASFVRTALSECGATVASGEDGFVVHASGLLPGVKDALGREDEIEFRIDFPVPRGVSVLNRTDPKVNAVAEYVLNSALDSQLPDDARPARRCGVIMSADVSAPTTALLVRFRIHLTLPGRDVTNAQVAEEARVVAFTGPPNNPHWLDRDDVAVLLNARPSQNVPPAVAENLVSNAIQALSSLNDELNTYATTVADELRDAHIRVRTAARGDRAGRLGVRGLEVRPQLPPDVLGVYLYRPVGGAR